VASISRNAESAIGVPGLSYCHGALPPQTDPGPETTAGLLAFTAPSFSESVAVEWTRSSWSATEVPSYRV
jgi:hypothetical protein